MTNQLIEDSKDGGLTPKSLAMVHYFIQERSNFDQIEEEDSDNDSKISSESSLEMPMDENLMNSKEMKLRKRQAKKPINNIGLNNYNMRMR